ncbi:MAG: sulfatase-like hydrolase/transferase [Bacteroidales bacterium]
MLEVDGYVTDIITNMAINWIENRQDTSPFLLMCQHKAPHREWMPAQRHVTDFMTWKIPEPPTLQDDYAHMGSAAREAEMRIMDHMGYSNDNKIKPEIVDSLNLHEFYNWYKPVYYKNYDRMTMEEKQHWDSIYDPIITGYIRDSLYGEALLKWRYQRYMQDYLATIKSVDESVGSILKYLDEKGMAENTVVVYTSDQDFTLGSMVGSINGSCMKNPSGHRYSFAGHRQLKPAKKTITSYKTSILLKPSWILPVLKFRLTCREKV